MTASANDPNECVACGERSTWLISERECVRSNVRMFQNETFEVWRCRNCLSLHACEEVDLGHYYSNYPFHRLKSDTRTSLIYDNLVKRLVRAGLKYGHRILDYGCGSGAFARHLKRRGYPHVVGYDQFSREYNDTAALECNYDVVLSQDVLEHVPDPNAFLSRLSQLVAPGGIIAIGTPNAEAIDLSRVERYVHALHLPYHRHIFSKRALIAAGERYGWMLAQYYPRQYANTRLPFLNATFYIYYMRLFDNSLDSLIEPPRLLPLLLRIPLTLFFGLFGYYLSEETDVMAVFRDRRSRRGTLE